MLGVVKGGGEGKKERERRYLSFSAGKKRTVIGKSLEETADFLSVINTILQLLPFPLLLSL